MLKFDDSFNEKLPLWALPEMDQIHYGLGTLYITQYRESSMVRLLLEWKTRGGELTYYISGEISYQDLYRSSGFVRVWSDLFRYKFMELAHALQQQMSDGGLCKEQWEELIEMRNEQKYFEQWCVV